MVARRGGNREIDLLDQHIGRQIRRHRLAKGVSQDLLAVALGEDVSCVRAYEAALVKVSAKTLYAISLDLGVPITAFYEGIGRGEAAVH